MGVQVYSANIHRRIPIQPNIWEATTRKRLKDLVLNDECMKTEFDLLEELREKAKIKEEACKQRVS